MLIPQRLLIPYPQPVVITISQLVDCVIVRRRRLRRTAACRRELPLREDQDRPVAREECAAAGKDDALCALDLPRTGGGRVEAHGLG